MILRVIIALPLLMASCRDSSSSSPRPSPSASASIPTADLKHFIQAMEANDVLLSGLQADISKKAAPDTLRSRVGRLKKTAQEASAIRVRLPDAEHESLGSEFRKYLALLDELERDPWAEASAIGHFKRLEASCEDCHSKFTN